MARQQFVAHPLRIHSSPPLVAVGECANSLITDKPRYLGDRKVGLTEIVRGEIGAELIENFTKAQAFRSQHRNDPARHARAKQWQQITKQLCPWTRKPRAILIRVATIGRRSVRPNFPTVAARRRGGHMAARGASGAGRPDAALTQANVLIRRRRWRRAQQPSPWRFIPHSRSAHRKCDLLHIRCIQNHGFVPS